MYKFGLRNPVCLVKQVFSTCISLLSKYVIRVNVIPYAWTCQKKYIYFNIFHITKSIVRLMTQCFLYIWITYLILTTIIFMLHLHAHKGILWKILIHHSASILLSHSSQNNLSLSLFRSLSLVILLEGVNSTNQNHFYLV